MRNIYLLLVIGILCHCVYGDEIAHAIQIVSPEKNYFRLQLSELESIIEVDGIKDRDVVVVSIAGGFRNGKSFMLNFFTKYLNAQYKRHELTDWLVDRIAPGFEWQSGQTRKTVGIWMWSEIFTHEFENGDKVAIILLDTQGMFDDRTSLRTSSSIFALSTMLSSVQCYNIMRHIREDDLQHLDLFTQYGKHALQQSNVKPFQKMIFLVRDWPNAFETSYGYHEQKAIDGIFAGNDDQTSDMREMRKRIAESFDKMGMFLMPYPGAIVAQGNEFTGDLQQIDPEFIRYVKELVAVLFAPENLTIKQVNGQKIQARDFVVYLQTYLGVFNGDTLPEIDTVMEATAKASNAILYDKSLSIYTDFMKVTNRWYYDSDFLQRHRISKETAMKKFQESRKFGGNELALKFQLKLEETIEKEYYSYNQVNIAKRQEYEMREERLKLEQMKRELEEKRNSQSKLAGAGIGATIGSVAGSFLGPLGAPLGGLLGGAIGGMFG